MSELKKAIFLDKDGTIIPDVPYNVDPALITLQPGVIEGLQLLKEDYVFIVISNQAGVARGYFTTDKLNAVWQKLGELLKPGDIQIEDFYFCPHHPEGKIEGLSIACECRKPKPGMLLQAAREHKIDLSKSWMIGDILNDVEAGNKAGSNTVLIKNGNETEWIPGTFRTPTFTAENFFAAAEYICNTATETKQLNDKNVAAL